MASEPPGPKPPVAGLLQVKSNWTTNSTAWSIIFHALKSIAAAWSGADIASVLTNLATGLATDVLPLLGSSTTNVNNSGTDLTSTMGLEVTDSGAGSGTKTGATSPLPINVALRASTPAGLRVRGGRFGLNFAGLDQTDRMTGSATMWSTATEAAWNSGLRSLLTGMQGIALPSGATSNPCVVSYYYRFAFRTPPLTILISPSTCVVQQRICTRRRRLGKGVAGE